MSGLLKYSHFPVSTTYEGLYYDELLERVACTFGPMVNITSGGTEKVCLISVITIYEGMSCSKEGALGLP